MTGGAFLQIILVLCLGSGTLFLLQLRAKMMLWALDEILKERDEMKERCKTLEHKNFNAEKESVEFQANVDALRSLQEEVDLYGRPSILAAWIKELKAPLDDVKKSIEKVFMNVEEACQAFKADQKAL